MNNVVRLITQRDFEDEIADHNRLARIARKAFRVWMITNVCGALVGFIAPWVLWLGFGWSPQDMMALVRPAQSIESTRHPGRVHFSHYMNRSKQP